MSMLFKVWSSYGGKKAVVIKNLRSLKEQGSIKLGLGNEHVKTYLEDGTEIDDDEILEFLPAGTVIYLLRKHDQKPWLPSEVPSPEDSNNSMTVDISSENTEHPGMNLRKLPWPKDFVVDCSRFSVNLKTALENGELQWLEKCELLNHLASTIMLYTEYPSFRQRNQAAKALIEKFPLLKSPVGDGYHGWSNKIYDKMRELRRRKRKYENNLENEDSIWSTTKNLRRRRFQRMQQRGQINWSPLPPVGEDITSMTAHKEWLVREFKKSKAVRNMKLVTLKMELCFSLRRAAINSKLALLFLKQEYPFLFTTEGMTKEFSLLMGIDIDKTFLSELNEIARKLIEISQKKWKVSREVMNIINSYNFIDAKHVNDMLATCLLLLPHLFQEDPDFFYKVYPPETAIDCISRETYTPHVVVLGSPLHSSVVYLVAEGEILLEGVEFIQTVIACLSLYYCCNIKYPVEAKCLYTFMEVQLLKLQHTGKVPRKVLTLVDKLKTH